MRFKDINFSVLPATRPITHFVNSVHSLMIRYFTAWVFSFIMANRYTSFSWLFRGPHLDKYQ